jgi:hypothetical protein
VNNAERCRRWDGLAVAVNIAAAQQFLEAANNAGPLHLNSGHSPQVCADPAVDVNYPAANCLDNVVEWADSPGLSRAQAGLAVAESAAILRNYFRAVLLAARVAVPVVLVLGPRTFSRAAVKRRSGQGHGLVVPSRCCLDSSWAPARLRDLARWCELLAAFGATARQMNRE